MSSGGKHICTPFVLSLGDITIQIKIHKHDVNWSPYQSMCQDVEYTFVRLVNL